MGNLIDKVTGSGGLWGKLDPTSKAIANRTGEDPLHLFTDVPGPSAAATLAQEQAIPLLKSAESGTLTDAQKATVAETVQGERAQGNQLLAGAGLGRSSSQVAVENAAVATGTSLTNDFLNQDYQEALSLLGVSNQGLVDAANLAIQQDEAMGQAFGQAAQSFALIYGNYEGGGGGGGATTAAGSAEEAAKSASGP